MGINFPISLMEFPLDGFEVIVGMSWLEKYKAVLDCYNKKVSLRGPKGIRVSYKGFVVKPKVKLISAITLKSCMRKGCPFILCNLRDTRVEPPKANDIPVVGEFADLFQMKYLDYRRREMWILVFC